MTKQLLSAEWSSRLEQWSRLVVGFSGGLDSSVLLHLLASHSSLKDKLLAVHVNHGISVHASMWQKHCQEFCLQLGVPYFSQAVAFDRSANLEERARTARYEAFGSVMKADSCLILAHHQDDQAETLLLQLFRGAGVDGLAAMSELSDNAGMVVARPLLSHSRLQLEDYAQAHELQWVEDESNQNLHYSRNYLRQQVMPLLSQHWPGVVGNIARAADHCQQAKANLDELAQTDASELMQPTDSLAIEPLKILSFERITNILRVWIRKNQVPLPSAATFNRLIHEVIFASQDAMPMVSWGEFKVQRYDQRLYLGRKAVRKLPVCTNWTNFPQDLVLADLSLTVSAIKAEQGLKVPQDARVQLRFRQGGEEIRWRGQTKQLKKLFQEWQVPVWLRDSVPLIYINEQLAVVVQYAISDDFFTKEADQAWSFASTFNTQAS